MSTPINRAWRCRCGERRWVKVGGYGPGVAPDLDLMDYESFQVCEDCGEHISLGLELPPERAAEWGA